MGLNQFGASGYCNFPYCSLQNCSGSVSEQPFSSVATNSPLGWGLDSDSASPEEIYFCFVFVYLVHCIVWKQPGHIRLSSVVCLYCATFLVPSLPALLQWSVLTAWRCHHHAALESRGVEVRHLPVCRCLLPSTVPHSRLTYSKGLWVIHTMSVLVKDIATCSQDQNQELHSLGNTMNPKLSVLCPQSSCSENECGTEHNFKWSTSGWLNTPDPGSQQRAGQGSLENQQGCGPQGEETPSNHWMSECWWWDWESSEWQCGETETQDVEIQESSRKIFLIN